MREGRDHRRADWMPRTRTRDLVEVHRAEIESALEDVFDQAIMFHAFADYMRDYDVFIHATSDPRTGVPPVNLRYRFTHCVQVTTTTALSPEIWARSLDERLKDYDTAIVSDLDGYVWGVKWQALYPGMSLAQESPAAETWSAQLGLPFYEIHVRTNGHNLALVFSDLVVTAVEPGHAAFVIPPTGPDSKFPLA
jgi:hypothetical protein